MAFHGRTRGSARFEPYYKLQWRDASSLVWRDIQASYPTAGAALASTSGYEGKTLVLSRMERRTAVIPAGCDWRLVRVDEHGRHVIEP